MKQGRFFGRLRSVKWDNLSLQIKLVAIFSLTIFFIIIVNAMMFINVNTMVNSLEQIYVSNLNLDGLLTSAGEVQVALTEYLDTKSSDALNKYYRSEQSFRDYLSILNTSVTDDEMLIAEKNIYNLSVNYISIVEQTIDAKRGRDVERYNALYETATAKYKVVESFIYSLNNAKFRANNSDYRLMLTSLKYLEIVNLSVLIIAGILDIIMMIAFTGSVIRPLRTLSDAAGKVSRGDFDVTVETYDSEDEIGILSKTFSQMLASIRQYVARLRDSLLKENELKEKELMMETRMKDAQLKYLQAQINPHFLFNTLNAGAQLAYLEGADKTAVFIDNMASFFRYNISKLEEDTTIGEELAIVDNYMYILNVRFAGEIHYHKNVDEVYDNVRIPSMILQPLVENAVNYGIRDIEREKIIEVSVSDTGDGYLELSVWDNGKGMSAARIEEVLSGNYESSRAGGNGIGIGNCMGRLELYFGQKGLLDIHSDGSDTGTEIVVKIPRKD